MTIFDVDVAYWNAMAILATVTLAYILVCWLIPPKKEKKQEQNRD